jgi:hypothetical protein
MRWAMSNAQRIFDRDLIAAHLRRRPADRDDFVLRLVVDDLAERLAAVSRDFKQALILAPDAREVPAHGRSALAPFSFERLSTLGGGIDAEALSLPRTGYDLIVSLFDLQIVDDVPGFLSRVRAHLAPDGLFLAAALGGDSLHELREAFLVADSERAGGAYARVAPFIPLSDVGRLLQRAGFALPVSDVETHLIRYATPLALMRELKALGASNPLADRPTMPLTANWLAAASAAYAAIAADPDGRVRASLEIVWMSGWAPHESQQKPLRPGSAEVSLTRVLGGRT